VACSNNFVRHAICEVLRRCESVLTNQVLNVEEVFRQIQSVLTSNDPVARAITLRHVLLFVFICFYLFLFVFFCCNSWVGTVGWLLLLRASLRVQDDVCPAFSHGGPSGRASRHPRLLDFQARP